MSDKIFDLEQQIMQCWNVVDDIDMLYEYFGDNEFFTGMDSKHADEIMNCMLGLKTLYQVKFEKTWHTFEDVIHRYHSNRKDLETITKKYEALDKRVIELEEANRILKTLDYPKNTEVNPIFPEDEQRIDNIGQNGNDGLHYEAPEGTMLFNYSIDDATPEEWNRASALYWESQRKQLGGDE